MQSSFVEREIMKILPFFVVFLALADLYKFRLAKYDSDREMSPLVNISRSIVVNLC